MNPEKKNDPTKKGSWWLTGLKLNKQTTITKKAQSLAAISAKGPPMQTALHREASTGLPASELNFIYYVSAI